MSEPEHVRAHAHSSRHREEIARSEVCGCFYCLEIFSPAEIERWVDDGLDLKATCALCPKCDIDSVIGDASGYPITKEFLGQMRHYWFDSPQDV